jgi:hypothetical protein
MDAVLDMDVPFLKWRRSQRHDRGADCVYQMPKTTGSFSQQHYTFAAQQKSAVGIPQRKRPPEPGGLGIPEYKTGLFGRLLPRRVERAGIVDLGHLVIGEAEHLAQDLVGVLAEQRGTGHLAR